MGATLISDQRAFSVAKRLMREITNPIQVPIEQGLTGDFPLAVSQADEPIGYANFSRTIIEAETLNVSMEVENRRHVDTRVRWRLLNAHGGEIASEAIVLRSSRDKDIYMGLIKCPHLRVLCDGVSSMSLCMHGECRLVWVLTIEDEHGAVLDEKSVPAVYWTSR